MKVESNWDVLPLTLMLVVLVSGCTGSPDPKCKKNENCETGYLCNSEGKCVIAECEGTLAVCYESDSVACYVGTAPCTDGVVGTCTHLTVSDYFSRCGPGCGPCNPDTESCCNGICVDTTSNPSNCGGCGITCIVPNAHGASCASGNCNYGTCDENFGDCDNDMATNGCEENLLTSATNCGACGATCKGNASYNPTCNNGICTCSSQDDCVNTAIPWSNYCVVSQICVCTYYGTLGDSPLSDWSVLL